MSVPGMSKAVPVRGGGDRGPGSGLPRRPRRAAGFTLIEVLMGVFLVVAGYMVIFALGSQSLRQDAFDEVASALEMQLRGVLDVFCALSWQSLEDAAASYPDPVPLPALEAVGMPVLAGLPGEIEGPAARVQILEPGLVRVEVEALWHPPGDPGRPPHRVVLERLVAKQDLSFDANHTFP